MPTLDLQALVDQKLAEGGGYVEIGAGVWDVIGQLPVIIPRATPNPYVPVVCIRGASPTFGRHAATILRFDGPAVNQASAGGDCIIVECPASTVENLLVEPVSSAQPFAGYGVVLRGHKSGTKDTSVAYGGGGIDVRAGGSDGSNANGWHVTRGLASQISQGGHGLRANGAETNAGYSLGFEATSCEGWGILDSAFLGNSHFAPELQNNETGDLRIEGQANYVSVFGGYTEGQGNVECVPQVAAFFGGNMSMQAPEPAKTFGFMTRARFDDGEVAIVQPSPGDNAAQRMTVAGSPTAEYWRLNARYAGSFADLKETVLFAQHEADPRGVGMTRPTHAKGAGLFVQGTAALSTAHRFALDATLQAQAGGDHVVTLSSNRLKDSAGLGKLYPRVEVQTPDGAPPAGVVAWRRDGVLGKLHITIRLEAAPNGPTAYPIEVLCERVVT